jgi:hypothetical protein
MMRREQPWPERRAAFPAQQFPAALGNVVPITREYLRYLEPRSDVLTQKMVSVIPVMSQPVEKRRATVNLASKTGLSAQI